MTPPRPENSRRGVCWDMPPAIVDKYFLADLQTEPFQYLTARTICGRCAVRASCLVEAIQAPAAAHGVRGGESASSIRVMHGRYVAGEATVEALATAALLRQTRKRGVSGSTRLRSGRFPNVPLIEEL